MNEMPKLPWSIRLNSYMAALVAFSAFVSAVGRNWQAALFGVALAFGFVYERRLEARLWRIRTFGGITDVEFRNKRPAIVLTPEDERWGVRVAPFFHDPARSGPGGPESRARVVPGEVVTPGPENGSEGLR